MKKPLFSDLHLASTLYGRLAVVHTNLQRIVRGVLVTARAPVGPNEVAFLAVLASHSELSVATAGDELSVTRAVAKQMVRRLSSVGFIEAAEGGDDRRMRNWTVSISGSQFLSGLLVELDRQATQSSLAPLIEETGELAAGLDQLVSAMFAKGVGQRPEGDPADGKAPFGFLRTWLSASRIYRFARAEQTKFLLHATDQLVDSAAYMALYRIYERPASMSDIATFLGVDLNTCTRLVERLERHGLLTRQPTVGNRRELTIAPTEKALSLLCSVAPLDPSGRYVHAVAQVRDAATKLSMWLDRSLPAGQDIDAECFARLLRDVVHLETAPLEAGAGERFRHAMAQFATGVAVVSVADGATTRCVTVNSIASVSLDPPTLLVCLDSRSKYLAMIEKERVFGLSFLCGDQLALATKFGKKESTANSHNLNPASQEVVNGVTMVRDAAVQMACRLVRTIEVGTHKIVLAQPDSIVIDPRQRSPLMSWASLMADPSTFKALGVPLRESETEV